MLADLPGTRDVPGAWKAGAILGFLRAACLAAENNPHTFWEF